MRRRFVRAVAAFVVLALAGCSEATAPHTDILRVTTAPNGIVLHNLADEPLHYAVVERGSLATVDILICSDPSCPSIADGASLLIRNDQIAGYHPGAKEAIVYHWLLRPAQGSAFQPDEVRQLVVPLSR